jgi:hypothetical protein
MEMSRWPMGRWWSMSRPAESSPSRVGQELTCAVPPPHGPHCGHRVKHEAATERRNPGPFLWARLSGCELPRYWLKQRTSKRARVCRPVGSTRTTYGVRSFPWVGQLGECNDIYHYLLETSRSIFITTCWRVNVVALISNNVFPWGTSTFSRRYLKFPCQRQYFLPSKLWVVYLDI